MRILLQNQISNQLYNQKKYSSDKYDFVYTFLQNVLIKNWFYHLYCLLLPMLLLISMRHSHCFAEELLYHGVLVGSQHCTDIAGQPVQMPWTQFFVVAQVTQTKIIILPFCVYFAQKYPLNEQGFDVKILFLIRVLFMYGIFFWCADKLN